MLYDYVCENPECGNKQEGEHSVSGFMEYTPECVECGALCHYQWFPTPFQFAVKDGPSGIAPSKAGRFKDYRRKQSELMTKRQKDRYGHLKRDAIPNYAGKETGTWQEAQFQALKEKGAESAATFNQKIKKEKSSDKKIKV